MSRPKLIAPGKALADYGPVWLIVQTWQGGTPLGRAALAGSRRALAALDELSACLATAQLPIRHPNCLETKGQPEVLKRMIKSVVLLGEPDFTPMAAVAGTFSDLALEAACQAGADRVLVNNGGDIALTAMPNTAPFVVGMVTDINRALVEGMMEVPSCSPVKGVATSGFGGRSLTKGVASAVTCWAQTCALADAAATSVANATDVDDPAVERCRAEELDPLTDLKGHTVVKRLGRLTTQSVQKALAAGLSRAAELTAAGMIIGYQVTVQGHSGASLYSPNFDHGNIEPRQRSE